MVWLFAMKQKLISRSDSLPIMPVFTGELEPMPRSWSKGLELALRRSQYRSCRNPYRLINHLLYTNVTYSVTRRLLILVISVIYSQSKTTLHSVSMIFARLIVYCEACHMFCWSVTGTFCPTAQSEMQSVTLVSLRPWQPFDALPARSKAAWAKSLA